MRWGLAAQRCASLDKRKLEIEVRPNRCSRPPSWVFAPSHAAASLRRPIPGGVSFRSRGRPGARRGCGVRRATGHRHSRRQRRTAGGRADAALPRGAAQHARGGAGAGLPSAPGQDPPVAERGKRGCRAGSGCGRPARPGGPPRRRCRAPASAPSFDDGIDGARRSLGGGHRRRPLRLRGRSPARGAAGRRRPGPRPLRQDQRRRPGAGSAAGERTMSGSAETVAATLLDEYVDALRSFVLGGGEAALARAYELGRRAVAEGLGVLDLSEMHHRALSTQILGLADSAGASALVWQAAAFFTECAAPFEITHRGYREANARLWALNETLEQQVAERTRELLAERKAAEEEQARHLRVAQEGLRARDAFLSIASHELRTPLTALKLRIDHLLRLAAQSPAPPVPDVDVFQEVRAVQRQSKRLERLFANLLDVSNLNAGDLQLRPESVDLAAAVREILIGMREELAQAGCAVTFLAAAPGVGSWDRSRLDQIAINLLSNGAKYGRGKPVEVVVEQTGTHARLIVRDHGFGIAPDDKGRIFDRFERAVSVRHYGGVGLGLWIAPPIVSAPGGGVPGGGGGGGGPPFLLGGPLAAANDAGR